MIKCIFCLNNKLGTLEHVFPLAIGGTLTTNRVCKDCNDILGSGIDSRLSNSFIVEERRTKYGLAGNSGKMPNLYDLLLGVHPLTDDPSQFVQVSMGTDGKLNITQITKKALIYSSDGSNSVQIVVDESNFKDIQKIIDRECKRQGLPQISQSELNIIVEKARSNLRVINNPTVTVTKTLSFAYIEHALVKIAYELAFLWLGEIWLDDPVAHAIRQAIISPSLESLHGLRMTFDPEVTTPLLEFWSNLEDFHIAYAVATPDGIAIFVSVFGVHLALVWVSESPSLYLSNANANEKLRFLSINPSTRETVDSTFLAEITKLFRLRVFASSLGS